MHEADRDATKRQSGGNNSEPLVAVLAPWFGKSLSELPAELQQIVGQSFLKSWDSLTVAQQRDVASQIDYHRDPANEDAQNFWIALVFRRSEWELKRREMTNTRAADPINRAVRDLYLEQVDRELEAIKKDEEDVASIAPNEQQRAMTRVRRRWQKRGNAPGGRAAPVPQVAGASGNKGDQGNVGAEEPKGTPTDAGPPETRRETTATPAPLQTPSEAYTACVACLRAIADASPKYRTHTRPELELLCKGPLTVKAWRHALREAFEGDARAEWRHTGRRGKP